MDWQRTQNCGFYFYCIIATSWLILIVIYFVSELCSIANKSTQESRLLPALQLLLLLLPYENRSLLKDVLDLLHLTASYEHSNRMSADNLATLFTPHLVCPRKLTPEDLHINSQILSGIIAFLITKSAESFRVPPKLAVDIRAYFVERERKKLLSPRKTFDESISDNFAANTVYSFVDHERTAKENQSNPTETALAQLYAHIQSMPESSKKRKLVKQFNKENGRGTPLQVLRSNTKNRSIGDSIKKHIFQKSLLKAHKKNGVMERRASSEELLNVSVCMFLSVIYMHAFRVVLILFSYNLHIYKWKDVQTHWFIVTCHFVLYFVGISKSTELVFALLIFPFPSGRHFETILEFAMDVPYHFELFFCG